MPILELPIEVVVKTMIDCIDYTFDDANELTDTMVNLLNHCALWEDFDWNKIKDFAESQIKTPYSSKGL